MINQDDEDAEDQEDDEKDIQQKPRMQDVVPETRTGENTL